MVKPNHRSVKKDGIIKSDAWWFANKDDDWWVNRKKNTEEDKRF